MAREIGSLEGPNFRQDRESEISTGKILMARFDKRRRKKSQIKKSQIKKSQIKKSQRYESPAFIKAQFRRRSDYDAGDNSSPSPSLSSFAATMAMVPPPTPRAAAPSARPPAVPAATTPPVIAT
jgi:hypothetical protein